ncbi:hypothetical protein JG688_00008028 [Phytophthora aleatoria]|uniref:Uncharacterized protein n=1 Tax=Phytophthora aleatoria TaxID=2496075 RepID=A0A8J5J7D8_9STRA|nr:hypothetical protein JG688_00008028 [Phytophthora aleatoria]
MWVDAIVTAINNRGNTYLYQNAAAAFGAPSWDSRCHSKARSRVRRRKASRSGIPRGSVPARTMGRQRRGVVGCTNLPALTHNCEARTDAHHLPRQQPTSTESQSTATLDAKADGRVYNDAMDRRQLKREKFKLPSISSSVTDGTANRDGQCRTKRKLSPREAQLDEHEQAKQILATSIDSHETASKSYKNEHWYSSPIGFGSRKSVLLAALKSRDPGGSGFITCKQLVHGLQAPNFGLDERQARALLVKFDDQLLKDYAEVPYRSFVKHLKLPQERSSQPGQDPTIFHQESYINRVRAHAAQLIEKVAAVEVESTRNNLTEFRANIDQSRDAAATQNNVSTLVDVDRLSFEFDKDRKQRRAEAKSRILSAHIDRIEAFSLQQHKLIEEHESMRLAAKALHRHAHFEQAFEEVSWSIAMHA